MQRGEAEAEELEGCTCMREQGGKWADGHDWERVRVCVS